MVAWILILVAWVACLSLILHDVTKEEAAGSAVLIGARKVGALIVLTAIRFRKFRRARARAIARARAEQQAAVEAAAAAAAKSPSPEPKAARPALAEVVSEVPTSPEPVSVEPASAELTSGEPTSAEPMPAETVSPEIAPLTPIPPEEPSQPEIPQQVAPEAIKLAPEVMRRVAVPETSAPKKKRWFAHDDRAARSIPELETAITHAVKSAAPDCKDFVGVIVRQKTPKSRHDVNWELQGVRFGKADKKLVNDTLRGIVKQMQREYRVPDQ
jgi:hypothetical protein